MRTKTSTLFHNSSTIICICVLLWAHPKNNGNGLETRIVLDQAVVATNLDLASNSSGVHSAGNVHRVTPDIVLWFTGANHTCHHCTMIETYIQCTCVCMMYIYVCMYVCMYDVCVYVCMYVCIMYVYMYLCMHVYVAVPGRIEHYSVAYFNHVTVFETL